ncbi:unnamed protein product, partial [Prorocentrum cordatum]
QESQALSALDRTLLFRNQLGSAREGQGPYPIESVPYLAIGDIHDARNIPKLLAANVGAVLNLSDFEGSFEKYAASGIAYQKIDCLDMPGFPIIAKSFPTARMFMDGQVQRGKRILVHCSMGINRSATICVAYLMARMCHRAHARAKCCGEPRAGGPGRARLVAPRSARPGRGAVGLRAWLRASCSAARRGRVGPRGALGHWQAECARGRRGHRAERVPGDRVGPGPAGGHGQSLGAPQAGTGRVP